ncbi:MAG: hypothetical protein KDD06_18140 [Phaeodactylibacter sp.]|nr:hypothetical protein [Phaeodactylibacter sp.]
MRNSLFVLCLFTLVLGGCSGSTDSNSEDGGALEDSTTVAAENEATRPAMLSRKNRVPFEKKLDQAPLRFQLSSPNVPDENTLVITASGLETRNDTFQVSVAGLVFDAQLADLDKDGYPEVYAFARSTGSDSTAYVYAFSSYRNRSYGPVGVSELAAQKEMAEGFNGHDRFFFEDGVLMRSFPIYQAGKPTGQWRVITYSLRQGEASFILEPISSEVVDGD